MLEKISYFVNGAGFIGCWGFAKVRVERDARGIVSIVDGFGKKFSVLDQVLMLFMDRKRIRSSLHSRC